MMAGVNAENAENIPLLPHREPELENLQHNGGILKFSFRRLLAFVGPGFLVSIAYLDPGNIEADLQSGTAVGYKLLWVLLLSTILGLLMQRLAARIGVVTGYQMSELCYQIYPVVPRVMIWIMIEIAVIGADIQQVIGAAIAFRFLSNEKIPLKYGVLITILDTLTFYFLEDHGLKRVGYIFGFLIVAMFGSFIYEYIISDVDQLSVLKGIFIPYCSGCGTSNAWAQEISIFGACIMPHNLYLHSYLVKSRETHSRNENKIRIANTCNVIETGFSLFVAFIINVFIMSVFAKGLFEHTNASVHKLCAERNSSYANYFPDNDELVTDMNIFRGGVYLGCAYGGVALYIWAAGIVVSGQGSTITGTYSGQVIMEGFLNLQWKRWKRILVTRSIAILPTLILANVTGIKQIMQLNDEMNILMAVQLPFALIPAITLSNSPYVMREFHSGKLSRIILSVISLIIVAINVYVVGEFLLEIIHPDWVKWLILAVLGILYVGFIMYLLLFQYALQGFNNVATRLVMNSNTELWKEVHSGGNLPPPPVTEMTEVENNRCFQDFGNAPV